MKKILLILLIIIVFYALKQLVYKPYAWKKAINTPEHKLQLGSFIFSKQRGHNGSQSFENKYFIFKVTEINGDYVRLSVIRQLSQPDKLLQSDFSTTKDSYNNLKENIRSITITPILSEDLYKGDASYIINDYLLEKYPVLATSRYYYEDLPEDRKKPILSNNPDELNNYFNMVYSKKEIIKNGKLVPYTLNYNNEIQLSQQISENIDLILNCRVLSQK
ncbi:hypothetical protein [Flavobacterium chungangense]|uniref:hypothetical protein n=2 Tax=Flavobacterium chungangense TaxID=554283 RepID=UPI0004DECC8B|nr:hypothetical protein [Flavobacterium chungangense]